MGCGCGGNGGAGMVYRIRIPGQETTYRENIGEARVLRAQGGYATVIEQVPRSEMEAWQAAREQVTVAGEAVA